MNIYKYKAQSLNGKTVNGVIEAYDEFDAVTRIKQECPIVISVEQQKEKGGLMAKQIGGGRKIKLKQLALLCKQFSIIIGSGLPMVRAIELVAAQTEEKTLRKILLDVAGDVAAGHSLADSFEKKGNQIPITFIETVRAGEESGTLEVSFANLYDYFDKSAKVRDKVVSAMIYPIFLMVIAVIVVIILMTTAIPMFAEQLAGMDMELPLVTQLLIVVSNFMKVFWPFIIMGISLIVLGIIMWSKTPAGAKVTSKIRLNMPLFKNMEKMNAASQFANTMCTILAAGMSMNRALVITSKVISNYFISTAIRDMVSGVEEGRRLVDCMSDCKYLPNLLVEMAGVGEDSGNLEGTLRTVADYYDNEVALATSRMLSVLEPAIIVGMAGIVIVLVLGFYLPMFQMYGGMG